MKSLTEIHKVMICRNGKDEFIDTYFPHEFASMLRSHDVVAVYIPPYLRRQAF